MPGRRNRSGWQQPLRFRFQPDHRPGRSRVISWSNDPAHAEPLRQLLLQTDGPLPALREALDGVEWVEQAFVLGPWARRFAGQDGPPPGDIDIMIVFDPDHPAFTEQDTLALFGLVDRASELVKGAAFTTTPVDVADWRSRTESAFLRQVAEGPRVGLVGDDHGRLL